MELPDLVNHKVDTNIMTLGLIELELLTLKSQISTILAAILFSGSPILNLMTSLIYANMPEHLTFRR